MWDTDCVVYCAGSGGALSTTHAHAAAIALGNARRLAECTRPHFKSSLLHSLENSFNMTPFSPLLVTIALLCISQKTATAANSDVECVQPAESFTNDPFTSLAERSARCLAVCSQEVSMAQHCTYLVDTGVY